ncbi:MAG: preprotein translocase subunit SecA [Bdellovibrionales bacterium]|nr:preprotein translocase subunit SecA [Bdellovibrionales bacterium]
MAILKSVQKIFGTQNDRELKAIAPLVNRINELEKSISTLTDPELQAKTAEFRERISRGQSLDAILPEAFAVCREASKRVLGQRHYDVQLVGGITLHKGRIAEMKTGEGKTLTATAPMYLNGLSGKGAHLVTVNDYLARRDSEHMGQVYGFLGLRTGIIVHGLTDVQRKQNYGADITYGTNNEFGFDYLRDNMKFRLEDYVQRELNFAVVDEVDSILIDEARTPLIISGPSDDSSHLYTEIDAHIRAGGGLVKEEDYTIDEKQKSASLTEKGIDKMESRMGMQNLYDPRNIEVLHHVNQALRAHVIYKRDVDYVVRDGEVMIVDEFTGRLMPGRRWSDGLHQAIEAKEGVDIESENQTLATITFQNYFRMYNKLAGMTGTADTEAAEFKQIYKLDVTVIPTNRPMIRIDNADVIYKNQRGKYKAAVEEIKRLHEKGQPVLVGTTSVEKSEVIHNLLKQDGIRHSVLNAKQHEREAYVVAQAGRKGAITIATNMAGRGTDILLGGNPDLLAEEEVGKLASGATAEERAEWETKYEEARAKWKASCATERDEVKAAGGLFILGTERHESRRIDNQLRGRSGRQGDAGGSRFYLSFEDDLLRIFGHSSLLQATVQKMEEDEPVEHRWTTKAIENAQKKVEGHNYDIRKHLLEYDDVMNQQRKIIYALRKEVLSNESLRDMVFSFLSDMGRNMGQDFFPNGKLRRNERGMAELNMNELKNAFATTLQFMPDIAEKDIQPFNHVAIEKLLLKLGEQRYGEKEKLFGTEMLRHLEKMILLTTIDQLWKDHLLAMDHLRDGVGLQGYGQKDPIVVYKMEAFRFFEMMMDSITTDVVRKLFAVQVAPNETADEIEEEIAREEASLTGGGNFQYNLTADGELVPTEKPAGAPLAGPAKAGNTPPMDLSHLHKAPRQMQLSRGPVGSPFANPEMATAGGPAGGGSSGYVGDVDKVGRNDPCPCGSGKKYKKCHGQSS